LCPGQESEGPWTMRLEQNENRFGHIRSHNVSSRARHAFLAALLFAPTALLWGCSGIVSGQSTQPSPAPQTYSISGTISPVAGGSGATLTLRGAATSTTIADSAGNYTFSALANGGYAVTPTHTGYTFSPTSQSATVNGANVTGINFTAATNPTFSISGTISPVAGGSGATVTLTGAAGASTIANSTGNYTFPGLANGTYTVTPNNGGYTFAPVNQSVTI